MDVKTNRSVRLIRESLKDFVVLVSNDMHGPVTLDAMRLRHQVFCVERQFENDTGSGVEQDQYDPYAHHLVLYHSKTMQPLGCARLINCATLPTEHYICPCSTLHPKTQDRDKVAEVSRLLITQEARGGVPFLALTAAMIIASKKLGYDWLYACMESKLSRRLQMLQELDVLPISAPFFYRGERCVYNIQYLELYRQLESSSLQNGGWMDTLVMFTSDLSHRRRLR